MNARSRLSSGNSGVTLTFEILLTQATAACFLCKYRYCLSSWVVMRCRSDTNAPEIGLLAAVTNRITPYTDTIRPSLLPTTSASRSLNVLYFVKTTFLLESRGAQDVVTLVDDRPTFFPPVSDQRGNKISPETMIAHISWFP